MSRDTWGLTSAGFYKPTYAEIRAENVVDWKGKAGENRDTSDESPEGRFISLLSVAENKWWEAQEATYNAGFRDSADDVALESLLGPVIGPPKPATYSTVTLTLVLNAAVTVPAGSRVQLDDTGSVWLTDEEVTSVGGGDYPVTATAESSGAIAAYASSDWTIVNAVTGWTGVANLADADLGQAEETDQEYRERARQSVKQGGVHAALLKLDGVTLVRVFENDTDDPDALYGETHWFEVLVQGGDQNEIAAVIWLWRSAGIKLQGSTVVGIVDSDGNSQTVRFTRPTAVPIHIEVTVTQGEGYPTSGDPATSIKQAVADWGDANQGVGDNVVTSKLVIPIHGDTPGIEGLVIKVEDVDPPTVTTVFVIADRQIATFDTANIDVIGAAP